MREVMMALGDFKFSISGTQYQSLQTSMGWRWAKKERFKRKPGMQFHGPDSTTKTLDIAIYPETSGDLEVIGRLKAMGDAGDPVRLVAGGSRWVVGLVVPAGTDLGLWVVNKLDVAEQFFMADGTPLEIKGTLSITEYGDDEVG
ncbi:phage tail protein [Halomonas sp. OfavH-34-E]|uniref:phage tail protein n=1 Tax=Halomonas sp. OfavH-34-E TaxID=2954491 RepID=UPI002097A7D9|nr:phage tail protein [Halomonas sp. OfavH-34-E]MCO7217119.1 phage tail protein [Halomonas sp. OfavH-34-E]